MWQWMNEQWPKTHAVEYGQDYCLSSFYTKTICAKVAWLSTHVLTTNKLLETVESEKSVGWPYQCACKFLHTVLYHMHFYTRIEVGLLCGWKLSRTLQIYCHVPNIICKWQGMANVIYDIHGIHTINFLFIKNRKYKAFVKNFYQRKTYYTIKTYYTTINLK